MSVCVCSWRWTIFSLSLSLLLSENKTEKKLGEKVVYGMKYSFEYIFSLLDKSTQIMGNFFSYRKSAEKVHAHIHSIRTHFKSVNEQWNAVYNLSFFSVVGKVFFLLQKFIHHFYLILFTMVVQCYENGRMHEANKWITYWKQKENKTNVKNKMQQIKRQFIIEWICCSFTALLQLHRWREYLPHPIASTMISN